MVVILKRDIKGTGKAGDIVKVSDGYARNMLIPKGWAIEATKGNINTLEKVKASECQDTIDFLARRLYNMTAGIIESLLLIEDAGKAPELFEKSANVFVRMTEEEVVGSVAYIKAFDCKELKYFKTVAEEAVQ